EQLLRERLGALDVAQRDQHLADADERARLPGAVTELTAELAALLERLQRAGVVAGVVDEQPAERVERRGELARVAEVVPETDRVVELHPARVDGAAPGRERSRRRERPGPGATRCRRGRQRARESAAPLGQQAVREPEPAERAGELEPAVGLVRDEPVERCTKVVVVVAEPRRLLGLLREPALVRLLGERGEEACVPRR